MKMMTMSPASMAALEWNMGSMVVAVVDDGWAGDNK